MSATDTLMAGLIDYAGLYPPAALDMRSAISNYLEYQSGKHAFALGRFVLDIGRISEFQQAAGDSLPRIRLSIIAPATTTSEEINCFIDGGFAVRSFEIKCAEPLTICRISERLPVAREQYFEIPIHGGCSGAIDAVASIGARAKLRMGGLTAEAFPSCAQVVEWLQLAADRRVAFKATAGLHHPIRSCHRFTYATDSPSGTMHGFINFFCAAAFALSGELELAHAVLEEEDPISFRISSDSIAWRTHWWTTDQVRAIRQKFFTSFGSCSFVEPLQDLEALGWL